MKRNTLRVSILALVASAAGAQTFEAASVKPAAPGGRYRMAGGPGSGDPGQITYSNATLREMLTRAYGVEGYQVEGPSWLGEARYDVVAKIRAGASKEEFRGMLRNLLAERFGLAAHRETKEVPIYAMTVGKNGAKLKVSGSEEEAAREQPEVTTVSLASDGFPVMPKGYPGHVIGMKIPGKTALRAKAETMPDFAKVLSSVVDRPVFDFTGLAARYDFAIAWANEDGESGGDPGPDVFGAMQAELGLRLEPRRAAVEMVIVDRVERRPMEN